MFPARGERVADSSLRSLRLRSRRLHDQKRTKRRGAEDAERFPFDFAQGRLSTARANNVRSAPLGYAPFMEPFRASRAGSVTMQRRKSGVEPPHSKNRGEQGDGGTRETAGREKRWGLQQSDFRLGTRRGGAL